jgi:hypothetical protein
MKIWGGRLNILKISDNYVCTHLKEKFKLVLRLLRNIRQFCGAYVPSPLRSLSCCFYISSSTLSALVQLLLEFPEQQFAVMNVV